MNLIQPINKGSGTMSIIRDPVGAEYGRMKIR